MFVDKKRTLTHVGNDDAKDVGHKLKHNQLSSVLCLGGLRLPDGDGNGIHAVSNSSDDSSDDHWRQ